MAEEGAGRGARQAGRGARWLRKALGKARAQVVEGALAGKNRGRNGKKGRNWFRNWKSWEKVGGKWRVAGAAGESWAGFGGERLVGTENG